MTDLQARLQDAIVGTHRIEKELGGGGMSRVFLAEELRLGRKVVIKVLPPEMGAGVNVERFEREIQLAARLQHPHIVPLLTAGADGDLLYYIMPFIEGESLRAKLAREGELPIGEALRILKEVLDALQYAHSNRVVHRDIKPDNVLLSGKHALVADFGVAKAVSESTGQSGLTSLGVALGTPAYMAPEQAAADPHVDHRADLYAVGALAYEMLTGRPPFTGISAQAILTAHMTQAPEPVTTHRGTVPPALNELILRCLQKKPADRPQRAEELVPHLDALLTPSGGLTPTATQPVAAVDYHERARKAHPARVAGVFTLAAVGVLAIVYLLVQQFGLPDWVFYSAIGLLVAGLPVILLTGHLERRRAQARATGLHTMTPTGLMRHATWRKALLGGGLAFGGLGLLAALFMLSRLLGIGPGATLLSAGVLGAEDRLLLARFDNLTPDTTLAETVTELIRIDLAQSPTVSVLEPRQVSEVLKLMQRDPEAALTPELAAEVATREGVKAYVAGDIRPVGGGFVVSARVVDATSGEALVAGRETAASPDHLIEAVDRLSAHLRERIGESLRSVRAEPPLEQVTTNSLEALRLYAQAERIGNEGDYDRAIALLEQATAVDSTFAMAWRRAGMYYGNRGDAESMARNRSALERAMALRHRLSDRERYLVEAGYATRVTRDYEAGITAYLAILEKHPRDGTSLNNVAVAYAALGRQEEAERYLRRAVAAEVAPSMTYANLINGMLWQGRVAAADTMLTLLVDRYPSTAEIPEVRAELAVARRQWAQAESAARPLLEGGPADQELAHFRLAQLLSVQGRFSEGGRHLREALRIQSQRVGRSAGEHEVVLGLSEVSRRVPVATDPEPLARRLEGLWAMEQRISAGRPMLQGRHRWFSRLFSRLGRPEQAQRVMEEFEVGLDPIDLENYQIRADLAYHRGMRAAVEGRAGAAVEAMDEACTYYAGESGACDARAFPWLALAYDRGGQSDSALAVFERWVNLDARNDIEDFFERAPALRRLGELYEARDPRKAIEYYSRFLDLWSDADSEFDGVIRDVRERIARLSRTAG